MFSIRRGLGAFEDRCRHAPQVYKYKYESLSRSAAVANDVARFPWQVA